MTPQERVDYLFETYGYTCEERAGILRHLEEAELEQRNIGSDITADKLLEIARTGKHTGVFGGAKQEACARAILQLRQDERERCAVIAENWGHAPPNPNGRRAALAAAIRSSQ